MDIYRLYAIISNELKDDPYRHQIASDIISRSGIENRAISFPKDANTKFVSSPSLDKHLVLEWVCLPELKLNVVRRPPLHAIYSPYIDSQWRHLVDDASGKQIPPELVNIICLYDPFHFREM